MNIYLFCCVMILNIGGGAAFYTPISRFPKSAKYDLCEVYPFHPYCSEPIINVPGFAGEEKGEKFIIVTTENEINRAITKRFTQKDKKEMIQTPNLDTLLRFGR
uniref:Uncharacterized protein n=1 Tax=Rhabditophanes sp. KR3021 TaxID=114890 RepID=A0AC35TZ68_9BILA